MSFRRLAIKIAAISHAIRALPIAIAFFLAGWSPSAAAHGGAMLGNSDPCLGWKLELLRADAVHGDLQAQYELGIISWDGVCGPLDPEYAASMLYKSASSGHRAAGLLLGEIQFSGATATSSPWHARQYLETAAQSGHVRAQQSLGLSSLLRAKTPDQREAGLLWLQAAARQGSGFAAATLGMVHERGMHGVYRDICRAVFWYERARVMEFSDLMPQQVALVSENASDCAAQAIVSEIRGPSIKWQN